MIYRWAPFSLIDTERTLTHISRSSQYSMMNMSVTVQDTHTLRPQRILHTPRSTHRCTCNFEWSWTAWSNLANVSVHESNGYLPEPNKSRYGKPVLLYVAVLLVVTPTINIYGNSMQ